MSAKLSAGLFVLINTCSTGSAPAPAPSADSSYSCESAFDVGCDFRANVSIESGTAFAALTEEMADDDGELNGVAYDGQFRSVRGTVTVTDITGQLPPIQCGFEFDMEFTSEVQTDNSDTELAHLIIDHDVRYDADCPIDCDWWMPVSGWYGTDAGDYIFRPTEYQSGTDWRLIMGSSTWLQTDAMDGYYQPGVFQSTGEADLVPSSWTAPQSAQANLSIRDTCTP